MTKMSTPQAALLVSQTVCRDSSINGRLSCRVPLACFGSFGKWKGASSAADKAL